MFRPAQTAVDDKRKLLEGEEADAEGQQDMFQVEIRMKSQIQVFDEKVIIFEIKEQSKVEQKPGQQSGPVRKFCPDMGKKPAQKIIGRNTDDDDREIINIKIAIEPQRHTG